jgi:hypothetical protein
MPRKTRPRSVAAHILETDDETSLLDVVDNALTKGVVLTGDLTLALAQVDLVYLRLSVLLCAADRVAGYDDRPRRRRSRRGGLLGRT